MAKQRYDDQAVLLAFQSADGNLTHAAKALGASRQTVANCLQRMGLRLPEPKRNLRVQIDKSTLIDLYQNQNLSASEIGRLLGVSSQAVLDQMVHHGIPRRPPGSSLGEKNPF